MSVAFLSLRIVLVFMETRGYSLMRDLFISREIIFNSDSWNPDDFKDETKMSNIKYTLIALNYPFLF